ncbi:MAG: hypothetical protein KBD78_05315 [Oligoflexales bacterium]|nr:hypothetical protein [Oligoflexales bacterium]
MAKSILSYFIVLQLTTTPLFATTNTFPWKEYKPGGDTKCAHGEEFSFFVHHGDPSRLVLDFFGGGACWNGENCKEGSKIYSKSVNDWSKRKKAGIYDHQNPNNPYKDWTHVLVPYCTGDIHWGEADTYYEDKKGKQYLVHHRGATNVKAVLKWAEHEIQLD